jgi:hypothetical protein
VREELRRSREVEVTRSYAQGVRKELWRLQEVEVDRTRPITQPHKIPVPERIEAVATNEQMKGYGAAKAFNSVNMDNKAMNNDMRKKLDEIRKQYGMKE